MGNSDLVKRWHMLRVAFEEAQYTPGDHPVVPAKLATFMDQVKQLLAKPSPPLPEAMMQNEPCPHCGTTEHLSVIAVGSLTADMRARPHQVVCKHLDCEDVRGPVAYGRNEAIAAWNRRAATSPAGDLVERLDAMADVAERLQINLAKSPAQTAIAIREAAQALRYQSTGVTDADVVRTGDAIAKAFHAEHGEWLSQHTRSELARAALSAQERE